MSIGCNICGQSLPDAEPHLCAPMTQAEHEFCGVLCLLAKSRKEVESVPPQSDYPREAIDALARKTGLIDGLWSRTQIANHVMSLTVALLAVSAERDGAIERAQAIEQLLSAGVSSVDVVDATTAVLRLTHEEGNDGHFTER